MARPFTNSPALRFAGVGAVFGALAEEVGSLLRTKLS
jgi:hypothetical protein